MAMNVAALTESPKFNAERVREWLGCHGWKLMPTLMETPPPDVTTFASWLWMKGDTEIWDGGVLLQFEDIAHVEGHTVHSLLREVMLP